MFGHLTLIVQDNLPVLSFLQLLYTFKDRAEIKLGEITPTRDFTFVTDTVEGFIEIFKSAKTIGEEINIATQLEISIGELAKSIIKIMDKKCEIVFDQQRIRPEKSEVNRLLGSNEKLLKFTNWKKQFDIETGLRKTIEWFSDKNNLVKYKHDIYNV